MMPRLRAWSERHVTWPPAIIPFGRRDEEIGLASPSAREAIAAVARDFAAFPGGASTDPLAWPGYRDQLDRAREATGETDSVVAGRATIGGLPCVVIAFDFRFIGGSMGAESGARIEAAFDAAIDERIPVVSLVASGGARMQEGMASLSQMTRTVRAATRARDAGVPHVAVLRNPTTGGVWASFVADADVLLAVEGATVAFAGKRVRRAAGATPADEATGVAERLRDQGWIDLVAPPRELPGPLALLLRILARRSPVLEPPDVPRALGRTALPETGAEALAAARDPSRPRADAYVTDYVDQFFPIQASRSGRSADGALCGVGVRDGHAVAIVAQRGTAVTAADLRLYERQLELAERWRLPVLTLIDTPGGATDDDNEQAGIGEALSAVLFRMASLTVPVTSLVIGEGGSGPAICIADPDNLWVTPDAYFSVIAPELAAGILKLGPEGAAAVAESLRLRPQDLVALGICRGIAPAAGRFLGLPGTRVMAERLTSLARRPGSPGSNRVA